MSDYITQSDIEETLSYDRLRKLTDDENTGSVDSGVVTKLIESAEAEVNQYVAKQYTTPVTGTIPEPLKRWSLALAVLGAYKRRPPVPEDIWTDANETRKQLRECAKGEIDLGIGDSGATEASGYEPEFEYEDRQFNRTRMDGW